MLKIGVLGAGHLGKIHIKLLQQIKEFELVGFYDPADDNADKAVSEYGVKRFSTFDALLENVDAVDVVTPTLSHYECAARAIRNSRHVFIEKPLTNTLEEAKSLMSLVEEANVKVQVGHVERFNPAFLAVKDRELNPMFIEAHRLAPFNDRGTDVAVILDLMIHDIDIILSIVKSNVKRISASGVAVISSTPDIANVRMEFDNGCVANLTASRISLKQMRKMRLFQKDAYITIDFLKKKSEVISMGDEPEDKDNPMFIEYQDGTEKRKKYVRFDAPETEAVNSIMMELEMFYKSIVDNTEPPVTVVDGYNAINVAHQILEKIQKNNISKAII